MVVNAKKIFLKMKYKAHLSLEKYIMKSEKIIARLLNDIPVFQL